jgi:hypothetical protein
MTSRRTFVLALAALPLAARAQPAPALLVYKSPGCGCCGEWEKHMRAHGFAVESRLADDIAGVKRRLGVPDALASCHTAVVAGYVVEGHVPAQDVRRLLRERPRAIGLAVPGMPAGAPGMEQGAPQKYATLAFDARRSWVFERH